MMNSDEKVHVVQANQAARQPRRGHCKRFWWVYLVVFLIILVIILPIIFLVIIPKVVQHKLDASTLDIDSITVLQTQPGQYQLGIDSTIHSDGKTKATIRAFTGQMYLEDLEGHHPFSQVDFPETPADAEVHVNVNQTTIITDLDAFTTFNKWLLTNETLRVTVVGDTHVRVSGIAREYPATFQKTVTLNGMNDLKGLNVTDATVSLTADALGDNFHGEVDIPNASIFTIELGNCSFHNYLGDTEIGTAYMDNLVLYPGMNKVPMRASVQQTPVLGAVTSQPYCQTGVVPFILNGKNVTNHGGHLSYFADALASANQTVGIDIGSALKALGVPVKCP